MPWSCSGPGEGELPDCGPVNKFSMQILHTPQIFQLANSQWCSLLLHKVSWIFFLSPHQFECGPTPEHFKRNKKYAVIVWPMCIIIYCLLNRAAFLQYWLQFRQYWKHIQNCHWRQKLLFLDAISISTVSCASVSLCQGSFVVDSPVRDIFEFFNMDIMMCQDDVLGCVRMC